MNTNISDHCYIWATRETINLFFFFRHIDVNNQCVVMVMKTFVQNGPTIKEDVVVIIIITCNIYDA